MELGTFVRVQYSIRVQYSQEKMSGFKASRENHGLQLTKTLGRD